MIMSDRMPNSDAFRHRSHVYRDNGEPPNEQRKEFQGDFYDMQFSASEPIGNRGRTKCDCDFNGGPKVSNPNFFCDRRYHYYEPVQSSGHRCNDRPSNLRDDFTNRWHDEFLPAMGRLGHPTHDAPLVKGRHPSVHAHSRMSIHSYDSGSDSHAMHHEDGFGEYSHGRTRHVSSSNVDNAGSHMMDGLGRHCSVSLSSHRHYDGRHSTKPRDAYRNAADSERDTFPHDYGSGHPVHKRAASDYRQLDDGSPAYMGTHSHTATRSSTNTDHLLQRPHSLSCHRRTDYSAKRMQHSEPEARFTTTSHTSHQDDGYATRLGDLQRPSSYASHSSWAERALHGPVNRHDGHPGQVNTSSNRQGDAHAIRKQAPARSYMSDESMSTNGMRSFHSPSYNLILHHVKSEGTATVCDNNDFLMLDRTVSAGRQTRSMDMEIDDVDANSTMRGVKRNLLGLSVRSNDPTLHFGMPLDGVSSPPAPHNPYSNGRGSQSLAQTAQQRPQATTSLAQEPKIAPEGQQPAAGPGMAAPGSMKLQSPAVDKKRPRNQRKTGGGNDGPPVQIPASKLVVTGPGNTTRKTNPGKYCEHDTWRSRCKVCKLPPICEHGLRRPTCKECGGSYCVHKRRWSHCRECGGSCICPHNRRKTECRDCGGSAVCSHKKLRVQCKICRWASKCRHRMPRSQCKDCNPNAPNPPPGLETLAEGNPSEARSHQ